MWPAGSQKGYNKIWGGRIEIGLFLAVVGEANLEKNRAKGQKFTSSRATENSPERERCAQKIEPIRTPRSRGGAGLGKLG